MHKICEACQFGKQTMNVFPHDENVSKKALDVVHSNVWGPNKMMSMGGCRYYVSFIDDHTRNFIRVMHTSMWLQRMHVSNHRH
jgi:hypothetical protein